MKTIEPAPNPPAPVFSDRRRIDRRKPPGPDLATPEGGLRPLPDPRPPEARLAPSPWPEGDFRVDPEA